MASTSSLQIGAMPSDFKYTGLAAQEAPTDIDGLMAWRKERSLQEVAYRNAQSEASKANEAAQNALLADQQAQKQGFKDAQAMRDYEKKSMNDPNRWSPSSGFKGAYTEDKSYTTGGSIPASEPIYPQPPPTPSPVLQNPTYYPDMRSNREFKAAPTVIPNPGDPYGITFRSTHAQYAVPVNNYDRLAVGHGITDSAQSSKIAQGQISAMMNTLPQSFTGSETFQTFRQNLQYFTDRNLLTPEQVTDILSAVKNNAPMGILQGGDWVNQLNDYVYKNGSLPSNFKTDGQSLASLMCQKFSSGTLTGMLYAIAADADISQDRRNNILQSLSQEYTPLSNDQLARSGYYRVNVGGVPVYLDLNQKILPGGTDQSIQDASKFYKSKLDGNTKYTISQDDLKKFVEVSDNQDKQWLMNNPSMKIDDLLTRSSYKVLTQIPDAALQTGALFQNALDNVNATLKNQPLSQWQTGTSEFLTGGVQQHGNIVDVVEHAVLDQNTMTAFASRDTDHPMSYGLDHPGAHALQTGYDLFESASSITEGNAVSGYLTKAATSVAKEGGFVAETFGLGAAETAGEALGALGGLAEVAGVAAAVVGVAEGVNELLEVFGVVNENYVSEEVTKLWNDAKGLL